MNIMMFCSNPVDGGTAKVFYELVTSFKENNSNDDRIYAGVNVNNPVAIYNKIYFLERLEVYSEEEVCKNLYQGNIFSRAIKKSIRMIKYRPIKENNIKIMKEYLSRNKINCIIIHNGGYVGDDLCNQMLQAAYECKEHTICRIYVLHNDFEKNFFAKLRFKSYDKKICREATDLVTVSNYTKNRILSNSYINKEIKVIYNGLPESNSLTENQKENKICLNAGHRNILMLGNFQQNKGQLKFIEAANIIKLRNPNVYFTFIGNVYDQEYFMKCCEQLKKYNLQNSSTILHGINNASEYMNLFDAVAVPSMYDESFGLISVEAMSKGVPVVAFACGGIPEVLVDGRDGYIVSVGDYKGMADRLLEIISDEEKRKKMGQNGRDDYIQKFSVNAMKENYYEIIEKYKKIL